MTTAWRYGETNPVALPVAAAQQIDIGDLVAVVSGTLVRASDVAWDTNLLTTQTTFHASFVGVAMQRHRANVDLVGLLRVATTGVFDFDCAAATFAVGALVGPATNAGAAIFPQKVVTVTVAKAAVGEVVKVYAANTTVVRCRIAGALTTPAGGIQVPATA